MLDEVPYIDRDELSDLLSYFVVMVSKEAQYLLASIVESSQDSIVSIDLNRNITSWNKGAENLYGYTAEEVVGKPLEIVMFPSDIQELIDNVSKIAHDLTVPIYETVRIHKAGRHTDLEIFLSPVRNATGGLVGVSTIARDITLRKMQEQQKDEFISVASHELKTPVTSIKAYTEIILERVEDLGDDVAASMIKKLNGQVDRLVDLIKTLLDTTKLSVGELFLNFELFDLNTLIQEQIESFALISNRHTFTFKRGNIKRISADRKRIGQVLTNLISNAAKYDPNAGEIIIATTQTDAEVEVSVQDVGIGIPKEAKDKVFERYFRIDDALPAASGIGLGLYVSAGIVHKHGGTMSVESDEGKGSTFVFTLPLDNNRTRE